MKLYLIKHGQSEGNLHRIITGQNASPLTDLGKEQARKLAQEFIKDKIKFDGIYTSDLKRAVETTTIICNEMGIAEYYLDKRLREKNTGLLTGKAIVDLTDQEKLIRDSAAKNSNEKLPGGESNNEMFMRVKEIFFEMIDNQPENSTILVIAHGGTLYNILVRILNLLPTKLDNWFESCAKNIIVRNSEADSWKIIMFNNKIIEP